MTRLFRSSFRRWFHAALLLIGAEILFLLLTASDSPYTAVDKKLHFEAGRSAAVLGYFLGTLVLFGRVLGAHSHRSFRSELRRIPLTTLLLLGSSYLLSFVLAIGKEYLDTFTAGQVEALDVFATLDGTTCLLLPTAGMIVLSVLLGPLDDLLARITVDTGGLGY
ncbi:MAG: hypothetical protein AAF488_01520 [Planctomycetota bacterium]